MTTYNVNIPVPVRRNTTAGWASDATIYPAGLHLQVTDNFYTGTDQPRFKIANGVDAFSALDFVPATPTINTIYSANDSLISNRTIDGDGYSLAFSDLDTFSVTTGGTVFGDTDYTFSTASGVAQVIYGDRSTRFYGNVGIGDAPQPNFRVQVYTASLSTGLSVSTDASASKAGVFTSNGVNGVGFASVAQASGGTAVQATGDAIGVDAKGINGVAVQASGGVFIQPFGGSGSIVASAILEANSTTKGFLPPRMTTTQRNAISSPVEGLIVWDTTIKGLFAFDGTNWVQL